MKQVLFWTISFLLITLNATAQILDGVYIKENESVETVTYTPLDTGVNKWCKRVIRRIDFNDESNHFFDGQQGNNQNNLLYDLIVNAINDGIITPYRYDSSLTFSYEKALTRRDFHNMLGCTHNSSFKDSMIISHYEMVEDLFYNRNTGLTEIRITGLIPLIKCHNENSFKRLFWLYYPESQYAFSVRTEKDKLTYYEIFSERHFSSEVFKETDTRKQNIDDVIHLYK